MRRAQKAVLFATAALTFALFGCDIEEGGGNDRQDAATGAGGAGAAGGAGGEGAVGAGGAGAAGGAGGAGAAGGEGGMGAAGGEGGVGAAGGVGGEGGAVEGCGVGPACGEGQICQEGRCVDEGCACPDVFMPVCGADGRTYGNRCEADCAGILIAYEGECREPPACPDANDPNVHYVSDSPEECARIRFACEEGQEPFNNECGCGCIGPAAPPACGPDRPCREGQRCVEGVCQGVEPCVCPDIFAPVCGVDGHTYGNECEARCAGVRIAHEGECREPVCGPDRPCPEGQACREGACVPVAVCGPARPCPDGQRCVEGQCLPAECACPAIFRPVCGVDGVTYDNPCSAECVGVAIAYDGECRRECPDPNNPAVHYISDNPERCAVIRFVCDADQEAFSNDCGCGCIDLPVEPACGPDRPCPPDQRCLDGRCVQAEPCVCADIFAPVCGVDGNTYPNACLARCVGVGVAYEGECREPACGPDRPCPEGQACREGQCFAVEPCICPQIFAPVCGVDGVTYGNECLARCAGVAVAYVGECRVPACGPDRPCARGQECREGVCVPIAACPEGPNYGYIARDPARCAAIDFICAEPAQPFFNNCGCGCMVPEGQCLPEACGPDRLPPVVICPDGSQGGPTGRCIENADGACGWEIRQCPELPVCGGIAGARCDRGERCENPVGTCRVADGQGVCLPIPLECPRDRMPVCGCNNVTYANDCLRQQAGVQKNYDGECRAVPPQ